MKLRSLLLTFAFSALGSTSALAAHPDSNDQAHTHHHHGSKAVPESVKDACFKVDIEADGTTGFNLKLNANGFRFQTPVKAWQPKTPSHYSGHAHLMVNGTKITRVYSEQFYFSKSHLNEGLNSIKLILASDDHENWMFGEEQVQAVITVDTRKENPIVHNYSSTCKKSST